MAANRITLDKILLGALGVIWQRRRSLLKILVIPSVVIPIFFFIDIDKVPAIFKLLIVLTCGFIFIMYCVSVHRVLLIGENTASSYGIRKWGEREKIFLVWVLGIAILYAVAVVVVSFILRLMSMPGIPSIIIAQLIAMYLFSRFSLVFPAIAIDYYPNSRWAWRISKDNWRLFFVAGPFPIIFFFLIRRVLGHDYLLISVMGYFIWLFVLMIEIAILSLTYHELTK